MESQRRFDTGSLAIFKIVAPGVKPQSRVGVVVLRRIDAFHVLIVTYIGELRRRKPRRIRVPNA